MGGGITNLKCNAFTLIELLAIIVILAIIAVITVPIILNIIENSRKGAAQDSAYGYKDSVNKTYIAELQNHNKLKLNDTYIVTNGTLSGGNFGDEGITSLPVSVSGTIPSSGSLTYENNVLTEGWLVIGDYKVTFNSDGTVTTTKNTITSGNEQPSSAPTIATCPGCKFIFMTGDYAIEGTDAENEFSSDMPTAEDGLTNDYRNLQKEVEIWIADDDTEYYDEYECYEANNDTDCELGTTSVQRPYFLGLIESTTDSTKIGRAFACGIENGTPFCLEGYDTSKYSDDYNVGVLNTIFQGCNASVSVSGVRCYGSSVDGIADFGSAYVGGDYAACNVSGNGYFYCFE